MQDRITERDCFMKQIQVFLTLWLQSFALVVRRRFLKTRALMNLNSRNRVILATFLFLRVPVCFKRSTTYDQTDMLPQRRKGELEETQPNASNRRPADHLPNLERSTFLSYFFFFCNHYKLQNVRSSDTFCSRR